MAPLTLAFANPKYLLIFEDCVATADELTEDLIEGLLEGTLRVIDLESVASVTAQLTLEEIPDIETL